MALVLLCVIALNIGDIVPHPPSWDLFLIHLIHLCAIPAGRLGEQEPSKSEYDDRSAEEHPSGLISHVRFVDVDYISVKVCLDLRMIGTEVLNVSPKMTVIPAAIPAVLARSCWDAISPTMDQPIQPTAMRILQVI